MQDSLRPSLRPDFRASQKQLGDFRTPERLSAHYVLERDLSDQLRGAARETRPQVYTKIYHELFTSLPDHPQRQGNPEARARVRAQLGRIKKHIRPHSAFLELGCGDAALGWAVAPYVSTAYGLDVTDALIDFGAGPKNFTFLHTKGIEIPLSDETVDFAYSNQLMEHLHPEDAADQLSEVCRVLKPGGRYVCITPSRVAGPHDVSCYFDYEASCLHLREYDYKELRSLFRAAGFRSFSCAVWIQRRETHVPYAAIRILETSLMALPPQIRTYLARLSPIQSVLGLNAIALK
jgi:SAM-dependent methyltransferase